jgi:hypothetical protein
MIYIVDIDQTICLTQKKGDTWDYINSVPIYYRIDIINKLYECGHTIIYWTARGGSTGLDWTELTTNQLNRWGCKYHEVRLGKPLYDVWVDDKAFNDEEFFD